MSYRLLYHPMVKSRDLPCLDGSVRRQLQSALENRLKVDPVSFGDPLKHTLKGYRKLRVGDYRVIYKVEGSDIVIYHIGHRKDVYEKILKRI